MRAPPLFFVGRHLSGDILFNDVIAEDHADLLTLGEVLRQGQRVGDAALAFLVGIVETLQSEIRAVSQEPEEVAGAVATGDDQDIRDPRIDEGLDRVEYHGLVVDGEEVFVGNPGQGK